MNLTDGPRVTDVGTGEISAAVAATESAQCKSNTSDQDHAGHTTHPPTPNRRPTAAASSRASSPIKVISSASEDLGELTLVAEESADRPLLRRTQVPARPRGVRCASRGGLHGVLGAAQDQLTDYLAGRRTGIDLPVTLRGTAEQRRVWKLLTAIPYGDTVTYGELAAALADGTTPQEVGQAVGRNPLSIVVPCHRVVGSNGQLTGYAGGLKRKQFLLELEEPADVKAARLF